MKWPTIGSLVLVMFAVLSNQFEQKQPTTPNRDRGAEVRGVFAAKCASCHGADLTKPEGRFGYVLDLKRIAENPEMVIPPKPEESELWILIHNNEMPPSDSSDDPLTDAEKQLIREWIEAGAPNVLP